MYNYINYHRYSVRYDEEQRYFDIFHEKYGKIISKMTITAHMRDLNNVYSCAKTTDCKNICCTHEKHLDSNCLAVNFSDGPEQLAFISIRFVLQNDGVTFHLSANNEACYSYLIQGDLLWGQNPGTDTFSISTVKQQGKICSALGPASLPGNDALFNRDDDSMIRFIAVPFPNLEFDWLENCYKFNIDLSGNGNKTFSIQTQENVYASLYSLPYISINKKNVFPSPPAGFMTWYALMWQTSEKTLTENIQIMSDKLKDFGANTIWVDWEWYHDDFFCKTDRCHTFLPDRERYPGGMKKMAETIKQYGFIPAIWIAPTHDVAENDFIKEHRDAILLEKQSWCGSYFLDPTHPEFLKQWIPDVFHMIMDWGYKAIKWDAIPLSIDYYDQYHDKMHDSSVSTEQALRKVVSTVRGVIGDETYLMSCHGEASRDITFACDLFDGARVGADIFKWEDFLSYCVERIFKYYPLHNVVQYTDPDNVVIREEMNNDQQAVSRVSFISLLGTPFTIGDDLTTLPEKRMELLRRTLPVCDIHPMDIYSGDTKKDVLTVELSVAIPQENYTIVDLFNRTEEPKTINVKLGEDLGIRENPEGYLLYNFWGKVFLGIVKKEITLVLKPFESLVIAIRPHTGRPQLLSTNRHITQGAIEIRDLNWDEESCTLSGKSNIVGNDPYEITVYVPGSFVESSNQLEKIADQIYVLHLFEKENTEKKWSVPFIKS